MQLKHDTELQGNHARYVVIDCLGRGAFSMTYTARVSAIQAPRPEIEIGMLVVVKTPTLDLGRSYYDKEHRLAALHVEATANYRSLQRLRGLDCVAGALDFGAIPVKLGQGVDSPAFFIVQEYVEGERFDRFLQTLFHAGEKYVIGASAFFDWARKISESLLKVHQRGVIHGDLWPENIMVRDAQPVLIDFGQGVFRDFPLTQTTLLSRPHDYLAPERLRAAGERLGSTWYVAADIYSLGGVLFYLATGEDPPSPRLRQCQDVDATKTLIVQELEARNPDLYNEDHGVADIIARCLRRDQHTRYGVVQEVLRDIDVFSNNYGKSQVKDALEAVAGIGRVLKEGDVETSLFTLIAMEQLVQLKRHVEDMETGVYDLIGDHRVLTPALSAYLSILEAGDKYFTVTVPSFWHPEKNLGINGRFLSMNYDIGMRGVIVRRIFLVVEDEQDKDAEWPRILHAHLRVIEQLALRGIATGDRDPNGRGYYTGAVVVNAQEREELVHGGMHFGVWLRRGECMLIVPVYREDGTIVSIRFRRSRELWVELEPKFLELLQLSIPLPTYATMTGMSAD